MSKLRVALIGGAGGFFGVEHRLALRELPEMAELTTGVLSRDPERARKCASDWGIRSAGNLEELVESRDFDLAVVATPNASHAEITRFLLSYGIPVLCEKPFTTKLAEAQELVTLAEKKSVPLALAYTYPGYWAVTLAKRLVRSGKLGAPRKVLGFYFQGWQVEDLGIKQEWRKDPVQAGDSNCNGDIGSHLAHLTRFITGEEIVQVSAYPNVVVAGRALDDDISVDGKLGSGAPVTLLASQVMLGHSNDITIEVVCERGSIRWRQEEPEFLRVELLKAGSRCYQRGENYSADPLVAELLPTIQIAPAPPSGHVSGFRSALATVQLRFLTWVNAWLENGKRLPAESYDCATAEDGLWGLRYISACCASAKGNDKSFRAL